MNHTPPCAFGWATFGVALVISLLLWAPVVAGVLYLIFGKFW